MTLGTNSIQRAGEMRIENMLNEQAIMKLHSINPAPLLCQSAVRKLLLDQAAKTRAHKFTRVSGQTMIELNEVVRQWCVLRVARLPSKGKTI